MKKWTLQKEKRTKNINYSSSQDLSVLMLKNPTQIGLSRKGDVFIHLTGKPMRNWIRLVKRWNLNSVFPSFSLFSYMLTSFSDKPFSSSGKRNAGSFRDTSYFLRYPQRRQMSLQQNLKQARICSDWAMCSFWTNQEVRGEFSDCSVLVM